jgi:hypothetical protein
MKNTTIDLARVLVLAGALAGTVSFSGCAGGSQPGPLPAIQSSLAIRPHAVCAPGVAGCYTLLKPVTTILLNGILSANVAQSKVVYCGGTTIAASKPNSVDGGPTVDVVPTSFAWPCTSAPALRSHAVGLPGIYLVAVRVGTTTNNASVPATRIDGPASVATASGKTEVQFGRNRVALPAGDIYYYLASCSSACE